MRLGTVLLACLSSVIYVIAEAVPKLVVLLPPSLQSRITGAPHHTQLTRC